MKCMGMHRNAVKSHVPTMRNSPKDCQTQHFANEDGIEGRIPFPAQRFLPCGMYLYPFLRTFISLS